MGSAQSTVSETAIAAVFVAGVAVTAFSYTQRGAQPESQPETPSPPASRAGGKKKKQTAKSPAPDASPIIAQFPPVVPGGFDAPSDPRDTDPPAPAKTSKSKKKKGKKAGGSGTPRPMPVDAMSDSSATAPESPGATPARPAASKSRKGSTPKLAPVDTDESWTRVESRRRAAPLEVSRGEAAASDVSMGITTTSATGNSSPVTERTDDELGGPVEAPAENRRTLAERLLPKPRKTGVDDMLETPDYPTVARVMRIQPGPADKPAAGFSWGDYEDVDDPRGTADDADGEDDGGWGVVKGRTRTKTHKSPSQTPSAPETVTKKQRQNAAKREAQKAAKGDAEAERLARLASHKRELERAKIAEQYSKNGKATSGGMTAYVDENGKLVWK